MQLMHLAIHVKISIINLMVQSIQYLKRADQER